MAQKSIKELEREIKAMETVSAKKKKRKMLEKKVKAMKFRKTTFGKVGMAITGVAEKFTRPAQKGPKGKVIPGTGGFGAQVIEKIKTMSPPPGQRQPVRQTVSASPMETAFATPLSTEQKMANLNKKIGEFAGLGPAQSPVARAVKKKAKGRKVAKAFDMNKFIRNLPA